ncbi:hypothetical protein RIEGSTA812A_PEG_850 [invertebrate metagenome]|uniref:Uncharacterized protein n=1 Tax=invertebrate metagenome TaxID=1711999 RepID=A0A484H5P9_9ZZZZ
MSCSEQIMISRQVVHVPRIIPSYDSQMIVQAQLSWEAEK